MLDDGKILCFDLSVIEEWLGPEEIPEGYLFGGSLKQVSSIHRFNYGEEKNSKHIYICERKNLMFSEEPIFVNRRYTGFLTKWKAISVFLYLCEGSELNGSVPLTAVPAGIESPMPPWLFGSLASNPELLKNIAVDPFSLVAFIEAKFLSNWSSFFTKLARDVEDAVSHFQIVGRHTYSPV